MRPIRYQCHGRYKVARLRHAGFCVWGRISTDSRKAAPCGDLPRTTVFLPSFRPLGLNRSVENASSPKKNINLGEVAHLPLCIVASPLFYEKLGKSRSFFCLDAKERAKEKIKTTALVGEPVVVQLKALNSLRSNSRAFLTLLFSFLSPSSLRSIIRFCETMLSQREAVFYSRLKNAPLCSFSFRPLGLNLSVENESIGRK